jgi:uncharacterized protein (DUF1778 family)
MSLPIPTSNTETHVRIVLNERELRTFLAALAKPPKPNQRLLAAAYRYAREVESRP